MQLKGKNALITGGASGFGYALCKRLTKECGVNVGTFDINPKGLEQTGQELGIWTRVCDVTDEAQVEAGVEAFSSEVGTVDILVNNAGIIYSAPLINLLAKKRRHSIESWDRVINLNLRSVFLVTSFVAERMVMSRTRGVIVNISSVSAKGNPGQSAYSAAKAAVNALTATWARELGMLGIRVVAVAPGFAETPSTRSALSESVLDDWIKRVPLRRLAHVDEITGAIIAALENEYFNGKVLEIDGGLEL